MFYFRVFNQYSNIILLKKEQPIMKVSLFIFMLNRLLYGRYTIRVFAGREFGSHITRDPEPNNFHLVPTLISQETPLLTPDFIM